ncbi:MAG: hypothetical protein V5A55_03775 [Halovenus sp.]
MRGTRGHLDLVHLEQVPRTACKFGVGDADRPEQSHPYRKEEDDGGRSETRDQL